MAVEDEEVTVDDAAVDLQDDHQLLERLSLVLLQELGGQPQLQRCYFYAREADCEKVESDEQVGDCEVQGRCSWIPRA